MNKKEQKQNARNRRTKRETAVAEEVNLERCQEVGPQPRIAASRGTRCWDPTDYGNTFSSPKSKSRRKNNFASMILSGVKSLSRLARFSTEELFVPATTETQKPETRLFLQREVSLSCLHGEYARFLSFYRYREKRERNLLAKSKNF